MSYTIRFTDPAKYSSALVIEDNVLNTDQTSLTFIGKNASGYASALSTNFLHLLENFANADPPNNPIEGQLWYDSANNKLKINDGTSSGANWKPINGIYQQDSQPGDASSGDIWVDTGRSQLFITLDGANWTLVGPTYSATLKTGSYPEQITDTFGGVHSVIKNYIDDQVVEVISYDTFVPQQRIEGFETIKAGLNLSNSNSSLLNATSYASQTLLVTTPVRSYVNGNAFVRNDIDNSVNASLNVRNNLSVGLDPTFIIRKQTAGGVNLFINNIENGSFKFQIANADTSLNTEALVISNTVNDEIKVGIDLDSPESTLDVNGNSYFRGATTVTSTLNVLGNVTLRKKLNVTETATFTTTVLLQDSVVIGKSSDSSLVLAKDILTPAVSVKYKIGNTSNKFAEIHSAAFYGNLSGTASSANQLTNTATFTIGDDSVSDIYSPGIQYNGTSAPKNFTATVKTSLIKGKTRLTSISDTDELLIAVGDARFFDVPTTGGRGSGLTLDIARIGSSYSFPVANPTGIISSGTGYISGPSEIITVLGEDLGGITPTNNLTLQITAVNGSQNVTAVSIVSGTPAANLYRASKADLFSGINYQGPDSAGRPDPQGPGSLVPSGTTLPYAGLNPPPGWLLCDGATVSKTDYPYLYAAIGYMYGYTSLPDQFKLPDLRGRMIIGYDNMTNNLTTSPSPSTSYRVEGANTPILSPSGTSTVVAGGFDFGVQYSPTFAGYGGTATGTRINVMNPYLAMNYIIKT